MFKVILLLKVIQCSLAISSNTLLPNEESLRKHIRQGLDAVAQDVLKSQGPMIWHAYKFNSGIGNREELVVNSIRSDDGFDVGQEVTEWQSLNVRDKSYAVGKMSSGFTVMSAELARNESFVVSSKLLMVKGYSTAYTMYKMWNSDTMKYDVFLIVATALDNYDLHWFRITENMDLDRIWWWKLPSKVTHIKMFEVGQYAKLLVINERPVGSETTTADIYDISLEENNYKFWLYQSLNLNCSSKTTAINKFANDIYLSIPQQTSNCVQIFKLTNSKFILHQTIASQNVSIVTDFTIGHRSFLAIGGLNSGIYQLTKSGLVQEAIIDINFEEVTYYLPLPVKSYRDEVILLVQHHIDYSSHVAPYVKVLIYSKGAFHVHDEIPCSFLGVKTDGATCIADPERNTGISGSAMLTLGKVLAVVVPRHEVESGLFYFDWRLMEVDNPIAKKVDRIIKARIKVEKLLQQQRKDILEIQHRLSNSLNVNTDNEISGNWKVNTVVAPNIHNPNMQYNDPDEYSDKLEPFSFESDFKVITDEIDSIELKILQTRSTDVKHDIVFDNLKINGKLDVQGGSNIGNLIVDKVNGHQFDDLVQDCVRRSQKNIIPGTKTFKQADVESLTFAKLNNVSAKNIAYNSRNGIQVQGDLTFKNVLQIEGNVELFEEGKVNDMDIQNELVYMNSDTTYANVHFENLDVDYLNYVKTVNNLEMDDIIKYKDINQGGLNIELDYLDLTDVKITTKHINDQEFTSFVSSLCLRNTQCKFPGNVTIHGKMHVKGAADINTLNALPYPDDYVLSQTDGFTKITGKKIFTGNMSVTELIVNGLVDGVNPDEVITCTTDQTIQGNFTFAGLEITESFRVDGDIFIGPNLTKFIPNPTLEDTETLDSNALFAQLEVDGFVIVSNLFNGSTLKEIFHDVVYKDEEIVPINVEKKFTKKLTVQNNLNVDSDTINNVNIRKILTVDTKQTISNHKINGKVVIENLEISGLFNGENLIKHFEEFIRLDADETVNSEIIFRNVGDDPDIIASELRIENINNMNSSDFLLTIGDRKFEDVEFKSVIADNVEFVKDLNYEIECFDIDDYEKTRFSLTKEQTVTAKMRIVNGSVEHIQTEQINDVNWSFVQSFLNISDIFAEKLISGHFKIEDLHIENSLNVKNLNNKNLNDLFETVFWINKSNTIVVDIEFQGDIVAHNLKTENLNGVNFHQFIDDIVLKSEKDVVLEGFKYFENGFIVEENLNTNKINKLPVENILLKSKEQKISGHVIVHGDILVQHNLNVENVINEIPIKYLQRHFKMDGDKYILKGNVSFQHHVSIDNLQVKGKANNMNLEEYLNNVVGIHDDIMVNGTTVFKKKVRIHRNLGIAETVDGVDLNKVIKEVVFISNDDYIQGLVVFKENVEVIDTIELETDLDTRYLCGCDVQEWINKAVYITDLEGELKFEKISALKNLKTDILNGVNMNDLIPLHTTQTIDATLDLGFVTAEDDIEVGNLVNGYNFEEEFHNTVMINKDQELTSHLIFLNPITITHNLKTPGLVNGKDLIRLVTTDTDQNLTASYFFNGKVTLDTDLTTSGRVNDINVTDWKHRTVTANGEGEQDIADKWKVFGNVTFQGDVTGDGLIGGVEVKRIANEMARKQQEKFEIENVIKKDYKVLCTDVQNLVKIGKKKTFIFKHLEYHEELNFDHDISALHYFKYNHQHYLIVSQKDNCYSSLYEWIPNSFKFTAKLKTGEVEQFITVLDSDRVYLVTKNSKSTLCGNLGANVWIFSEDTLTHIYGFNHSVLLIKSKLPGTFYSMDDKLVTEYKLYYEDKNAIVHAYRQWDIPSANYTFNPLDFKLDVSEKNDVGKVKRSYSEQETIESDYEQTTIIGNVNGAKHYLPAANVRESAILEVGNHGSVARFTAIAVWEEATVGGLTDEIKIYEDKGKLFDKISTLRPSNLNVLQFGRTGETFLAFMEDYTTLKVYEYKGTEGFKLRSSTNINATKMISVSLKVKPFQSRRKFLLLAYRNTITLLEAEMYGDRPIENFHCGP